MGGKSFLDGNQVGTVTDVEPVAVGPVLMHTPPRIRPVIVNLTPKEMSPESPDMFVFTEIPQVLMAGEHIVDIPHIERQVVQTRPFVDHAEEHMMIDVLVATVTPVE